MIRDDEIARLSNYIKGLGLKITLSSKKSISSDAEWSLDNSEITVYDKANVGKINVVLSLIHEIGHALHNLWEKGRVIDKKFEKAIDAQNVADKKGLVLAKKYREVIFSNEKIATTYWHSIYKETNMKFPLWKLMAAMEFDIWMYEIYADTGYFPKGKTKKIKLLEIKRFHRGVI